MMLSTLNIKRLGKFTRALERRKKMKKKSNILSVFNAFSAVKHGFYNDNEID